MENSVFIISKNISLKCFNQKTYNSLIKAIIYKSNSNKNFIYFRIYLYKKKLKIKGFGKVFVYLNKRHKIIIDKEYKNLRYNKLTTDLLDKKKSMNFSKVLNLNCYYKKNICEDNKFKNKNKDLLLFHNIEAFLILIINIKDIDFTNIIKKYYFKANKKYYRFCNIIKENHNKILLNTNLYYKKIQYYIFVILYLYIMLLFLHCLYLIY